MDLKGRNALITGGAVRVGRAITRALAAEGANVFVHYHSSAAAAEELHQDVLGTGVRCESGQADLSDPTSALGLIEQATESLGPISVLVNSASGFPKDSMATVRYDGFREAQDLSLATPLFLTQAFADLLPEGVEGVVVNVTDVKTERPYREHLSYMLAKGGLDTLTKASALALAPRIRVNAVALGVILPPPGEESEYVENLAEGLPLERVGGPEVVADAVVFLAKNDFITGEIVRIDGGAHLV